MDLFVDAIDSKLQPSEGYTKLVTNREGEKNTISKPSVKNKNVAKKTKANTSPQKKVKTSHDTSVDTPVAEPDKTYHKEDEKPVPFLNCLIESCIDLVRMTNQICSEENRTVLSSKPNSDKLSEISKKCQKSIDTIKSMIVKVAPDHVFDKDTNPLDVLFDEIEFGLKRKHKTSLVKYASLKPKEAESDKELKQKSDGDESVSMKSSVNEPDSDIYKSKKSFRKGLIQCQNSTLSTYSFEIDLSKYKLAPRPQDNWKDSIDNFATVLHKNKYEKFNQIEPQVKYTKEIKESRLFEKNFVPKIYPKNEFLRYMNDIKVQQAHLYSQELNSLVWSEDKLNSTHQGYNILGSEWNLLKITEPCELNDPDYKMVLTEEQFDTMIEEIRKGTILSIDVEHHNIGTYRGFVCLIQMSTPFENYIVDPFNMFTYINNLNKVTTDPKILKILHGSTNDVVWLQRDFGVYIVNMFDTREAAMMLNLAPQSLAKLLYKYFGIKLNKKYQLSDWSKRPLNKDMLNYACSDSCYLIPLYVKLKNEILSKSHGKIKMLQVMNNCRNICLKQYVDRGIELNKKFRTIIRKNKMQISALDFVTYNFMLNLVSFRNYAARKLDVSECMIINDSQILQILKTVNSGHFEHLVSLMCDYLSLVKYEIANLIKIKNTIEMIHDKLNKSELILIRPRSMQFVLNCLNNKNDKISMDQIQLDEFEKMKQSTCIDNTLRVYNKFVAGGLFNNISPIQLDLKAKPESQAEETTKEKRSLVEEAGMVEDWKRKRLNV